MDNTEGAPVAPVMNIFVVGAVVMVDRSRVARNSRESDCVKDQAPLTWLIARWLCDGFDSQARLVRFR